MVSADNLHLDVLELVFAYLSGNDLVAVSLVSRSFLAGVIPMLYASIAYKARHAKQYSSQISPFTTIQQHPDLAVHIRNIDIQAVPRIRAQIHPQFLAECAKTVSLAANLSTFICYPKIMPTLLPALQNKERLVHLHVHAPLTSQQTKMLAQLRSVRRLMLDYPSWSVIDILPDWTSALAGNLTRLSIYTSLDVHETVLSRLLASLPNLRSLYIVGCPQITHNVVLSLISQVPRLEELGFTMFDSCPPTPSRVELPNLHHLALDVRPGTFDFMLATITSLFQICTTSALPVRTLIVKFSEPHTLRHEAVDELLKAFSMTVTRLIFLDCHLSIDSIKKVTSQCSFLERFEVPFPRKEMREFAAAIAKTESIRDLIDVGESHSSSVSLSHQVVLTRETMRELVMTVPTLKHVVSDGRQWSAEQFRRAKDTSKVSPQKRPTGMPMQWFLAPTAVKR